jgi:neurotransmitter:Na+ symporter, NSS family
MPRTLALAPRQKLPPPTTSPIWTPTLLLVIFLVWLAENIWVKQAAPVAALGRGEHGAVIPMGFLAAYVLFLVFITI